MKNMSKYACALTLLAILTSCSNNQIYDAIQQNRQSTCIQLPPPQHQECVENYSEHYDSYSEKRAEVMEQ